jgi:hypothetical protein
MKALRWRLGCMIVMLGCLPRRLTNGLGPAADAGRDTPGGVGG